METAWSAWELLQLGCPSDHPGVNRMVGYLLSRQDKAGRWGEGCSERRHGIGHCRHSVSGFFSPGSRDESIAPLTLANGTVIASEYDARFAASCFALRVVLAAGQDRRSAVRQHVESLFGRWAWRLLRTGHRSQPWPPSCFAGRTPTATGRAYRSFTPWTASGRSLGTIRLKPLHGRLRPFCHFSELPARSMNRQTSSRH
jgi:hypothetical protein